MLLLIVLGTGIVFIAWTNTRRRKQDALERREVEDSTEKLKLELERTANEIIGRMENHVTHLENVLDESERNRTQLEGRVTELKKLLKKSEGQSGEIRDLLARLDDAGEEVDSMQRKMDVVERKLNLAINAPLPIQQPVTIPQMTTPLVTPPPIINPSVAQMNSPITPPITPPRIPPRNSTPAAQITTTPAEKINPLGPITVTPTIRTTPAPKPEVKKIKTEKAPVEKAEPVANNEFDKILEKSIAAEPIKPDKKSPAQARGSIVLSPEKKQPVKVVEADPVKIDATRKKLNEASEKMAKASSSEVEKNQAQPLRRKRQTSRATSDVRKAAVEAIKAAEKSSAVETKPVAESREKISSEKKVLPERRDLKLETTDTSIIKEMLLAGMSIEDISRETGLGRGAIELIQEMTRRQLDRR